MTKKKVKLPGTEPASPEVEMLARTIYHVAHESGDRQHPWIACNQKPLFRKMAAFAAARMSLQGWTIVRFDEQTDAVASQEQSVAELSELVSQDPRIK